jgi:DNA repair protein RadC
MRQMSFFELDFDPVAEAVEALAALLAPAREGEDLRALARRILERCEGLDGLARASPRDLAGIPGVGRARAARIRAAVELGRRVVLAPPQEPPVVRGPDDAYRLVADMADLEQEALRAILLNARGRVMGIQTIYVGNTDRMSVRPAEVFREAVRRNAVYMVLAHNHPSGDPTPSPEDIEITQAIVAAGQLLGIQVLDHLIIGRGRYASLREHGVQFE